MRVVLPMVQRVASASAHTAVWPGVSACIRGAVAVACTSAERGVGIARRVEKLLHSQRAETRAFEWNLAERLVSWMKHACAIRCSRTCVGLPQSSGDRAWGMSGAFVQVYSNEDVMVGAWMLGLNVEHAYEGGFCCAHAERCKFREEALEQAGDDVRAYLQRGGAPADGDTPDMRKAEAPAGCAAYGGGCNGVCGLKCTTDCTDDRDWLQYQPCVRAV